MDLSRIDNMEFDYDSTDYPDYSDITIMYADYDGNPMSDEQLSELNENSEYVYEQLMKYLY